MVVRLGLRIIELRASRRITQEQLAELVEVSFRQMQRIEAGKANPRLSMVADIAAALDVDVSLLFLLPSETTKRAPGKPRQRYRRR